MKPRSAGATKEERYRLAAIHSLPCAACRKLGYYGQVCGPTEAHHLTEGGRRLGHDYTIPLGRFHHRGTLPPGIKTTTEAIATFGPSLETSKRDFVKRFGSEMDLLKETNRYLGTQVNVDFDK